MSRTYRYSASVREAHKRRLARKRRREMTQKFLDKDFEAANREILNQLNRR